MTAISTTTTRPLLRLLLRQQCRRALQTTPQVPAVLLPITAHGPPPQPPVPTQSRIAEFRLRQKEQASKTKRFWSEVHVVETDGSLAINLDKRPLKTPLKHALAVPKSKPLLAAAIALEWSHLRSAADAKHSHLIPLTQMASRAVDMAAAEAAGDDSIRAASVQNLIRYLDTDTLLCWAPSTPAHLRDPGRPQLRDQQIAAAKPVLDYLSTRVWPGVEIRVVDGDVQGLVGGGQPTATRETLTRWMRYLDTWRFVGFERIVHATKSFVVAARMVEEWKSGGEQRWGIEQACEAASVEVKFQTAQWGEVEDTHDVEKEDAARQVGAGWLMIVGEA